MSNPFPIKQTTSLNLTFDEQGSAYSNNYDDIYFQPGIGLEEKRHVFLIGNNLPNQWQQKKTFTIAETGFGVGLNFLSTLALWHEARQNNQHLHYISCELLPLNIQQLTQALSSFPEIEKYTKHLLENYPEQLIYGTHRLHFKTFNTTLTLIFGDCLSAFENLNATVDTWYLDGFAPSKNPDMWSDRLFKAIANLSHVGTTAATYTVAGKIKKGLTDVGFKITKVRGFGQKREMLTAELTTEHKIIEKQPWHQTHTSNNHQSFTVIGAGIAGLSIAQKLQSQGKNVTLIDRQKQPCQETSGNPQAMIMPSFDLNDSPEARFYLSAFLYAIRHYSLENYHPVGVHALAFTDKQKIWQEKLLSHFYLSETLIQPYKKGILYPQAGWLDTQGHAKSLIESLGNYLQAEITRIEHNDNLWYLYSNESLIHTTHTLILANGISIKKLLPEYVLPITPKHGQISYFNSTDINEKIAESPHVQLNKGYITPNWNGIQTIGATFDHIDSKDWFNLPKITTDHWQRNTELWDNTPYAQFLKKDISYKSRAGNRVTTPDHLPICGAVIDQQQFKNDYHDIRHGKKWKQYPIPKVIDNLFIMTGLGSRGFTSAPILAEFLCNQILGQAQILDTNMQKSIHPNRFLYRQLLRS